MGGGQDPQVYRQNPKSPMFTITQLIVISVVVAVVVHVAVPWFGVNRDTGVNRDKTEESF